VKFIKLFKKNQSPLTEGEILALYRQTGEVRHIGELYHPYMQLVFSVCYKYLKDEEESKDAVMNIFEKLVFELKIHEVDNFKNWLHRVARNHCLMLLRSQKAFVPAMEFNGEIQTDNEVYEDVDEDALKLDGNLTALEKCMESLIQEQRVSINLFFTEEKCYREISEETGFDLKKVKSYIQNGKRNLKICMDRNGTK